MAGDTLLDAVKQARVSIEDCIEAVNEAGRAFDEDTQSDLYRHLDDADISLQVAGGLAVKVRAGD